MKICWYREIVDRYKIDIIASIKEKDKNNLNWLPTKSLRLISEIYITTYKKIDKHFMPFQNCFKKKHGDLLFSTLFSSHSSVPFGRGLCLV